MFKINGSINRKKLPEFIENVSVDCWDNDIFFDDKLGEAFPDSTGKFSLLVALSDTGETNPDLYFRIKAGVDILYTSNVFQTNGLLEKNIITGFIENSTIDVGCINDNEGQS
jgi:hypothetical protein